MNKHTPGPWRVAPPSDYPQDPRLHVDASTRGYVALCGVRDDLEAQANAHLIAAAPELLEACRFAADVLADLTTEAFRTGADKPIRDVLAAVIAKAEG